MTVDLAARIISEISKKSSVKIKDKPDVEAKLKKMIEDGPEKLQVMTDFDSTLTKPHINRKPTSHSIDVVNKIPSLSKDFQLGIVSLYRKYNSSAYNPELPEEEKQKVLNQWWEDYVLLLAKEHVTLENIQLSTENLNTPLRDGCEEMFSLLMEHEVPILVLSAGIGDVISHSLQKFQPKIIANFVQLDDNGKVTGFKEPYISVYNKHKITLPVDTTKYNIIVMGDSLGDSTMADNVPDTKTVLKIGFFSDSDTSGLEKFHSRYDIVLFEDETMNVPNALLRHILRPAGEV